MNEMIIDLISRAPVVAEVLKEMDAELPYPVRYVVKFDSEDAMLVIGVLPDDDTILLSAMSSSLSPVNLVVAEGPTHAMKRKRIKSIIRLENMQGYNDGIELCADELTVSNLDKRLVVFRFEAGASMILFYRAELAELA